MVSKDEQLARYGNCFKHLKVNITDGRASPHKICMLLATLDLAMAGGLRENLIRFTPALLEPYRRYFDAVRRNGDHPNPHFPFFHLSSNLRGNNASFWHLIPLPGREAELAAMRTARSASDITNNVLGVCLDPELHALIQDVESARELSRVIAEHWFGRGLQELARIATRAQASSRYERLLREGRPPTARESEPPIYIRRPAFRRVVIELYDYRCAATGHRVLLDGGEAMVEAAHIHPFAESGNDDPRNGLALTPDMHWAMDRNLIAPGPDLKWHVSGVLDDRVPDLRRLVELKGRALLLPAQPGFWPRAEVLAWRLERLREPDWRPAEADAGM